MKREIKLLGKKANGADCKLYKAICDLDNFTNECVCDDSVKYCFMNITPIEDGSILCLNCGGYIEYKEKDWL